jgi:signal transduction histidine kinase
MEAIGTLAAGVAHEINNPISGIIGYAEILRDLNQQQAPDIDIPNRIIKEADRIAEIVRNLLSFARVHPEEKGLANIKDILSSTLGLIENRIIKDGIQLSVDVSNTLPEIKVRGHEIQQVFLNILNNAHYGLNQRPPNFSTEKFLKIKSEMADVEGQNYIRTTFYDSGPGIPENILNKICDPFFSTKPPGKGTGLGLSISHGIIYDHEGKLLFDTVEGEYTKVVVDLPVHANPS